MAAIYSIYIINKSGGLVFNKVLYVSFRLLIFIFSEKFKSSIGGEAIRFDLFIYCEIRIMDLRDEWIRMTA